MSGFATDPTLPTLRVDEPIVALIRSGRMRDALILCVREHGSGVGRLCMALLGNQAESEEAVQETFVAMQTSLGSYRGDGTVRAWTFGIARRVCARRLETRTADARRLRLVANADRDASTPHTLLEAKRRAERVRAALDELKPSEREAILMRYEAGLEYAEIAHACGVDEPAARKRVSRALAHLRSVFQTKE